RDFHVTGVQTCALPIFGERPRFRMQDRVPLSVRDAQHMTDQRVELRPALGGKDAGDGTRVRRVSADAINRLGRENDQSARPQNEIGRASCREALECWYD